MRVYFDNAATTPMAPEVIEAMKPYYSDVFGNASSIITLEERQDLLLKSPVKK